MYTKRSDKQLPKSYHHPENHVILQKSFTHITPPSFLQVIKIVTKIVFRPCLSWARTCTVVKENMSGKR